MSEDNVLFIDTKNPENSTYVTSFGEIKKIPKLKLVKGSSCSNSNECCFFYRIYKNYDKDCPRKFSSKHFPCFKDKIYILD